MQRLLIGFAAIVAALAFSVSAFAFGGPNPNDHAVANCMATIANQSGDGTTAGGGPKAGIPAPANCDHYYQGQGIIGGP